MKKILFIIPFLFIVSCAAEPSVRLVPPDIPPTLRTCPDFPETNNIRNMGDAAEFVLRSYEIYNICSGNLNAIDRILREMETSQNR